MTHILDRLEKRRLIERVRDTQDRRKVFIRVRPKGFEPLIPKYEEIGEAYIGLAEQYDGRQLKLICDYMERAVEMSKHALANLIIANRSRSSQAKPGLGLRDRKVSRWWPREPEGDQADLAAGHTARSQLLKQLRGRIL